MKDKIKSGLITFVVAAVALGCAFVVLAVVSSCAPTNVKQENMTLTQLPRPDRILVYDFAVSPDEVMLDKGLSADLMQKYQQHK